jgi:RNA polymerase sigma-70 factor (ECF subfamily)
MESKRALTDAEKRFAEENINLVHKYLRGRKLPEEDFYDVVIFGYLEAIKQYMEREDLHKYAFSTIAYRYMARSINRYYIAMNAKKAKPAESVISLDQQDDDNGKNLYERIGTNEDFTETIIEGQMLDKLYRKISATDKVIVLLLLENYSIQDIAEILHVSRQRIYQRVRKIREIAERVYDR